MATLSTRKPQGRLWLHNDEWKLTASPHVSMAIKRAFPRIDATTYNFTFPNEPATCYELLWFIGRYPLDVIPLTVLQQQAAVFERDAADLEVIAAPTYVPQQRVLARELRQYQGQAVDLFLKRRSLLLGDDVGLGKTAVAIGAFTNPATLPVLVVTYGHLQRQWQHEIESFLPGTLVHIVRHRDYYDPTQNKVTPRSDQHGNKYIVNGRRMTALQHDAWCKLAGVSTSARGINVQGRWPDVIICTYSKLAHWAALLTGRVSTVVYDEIQEMRREDSDKYRSGKALASRVPFRLGLSATPVWNYGGEIHNVMEVLQPGCLGDWPEFAREWCATEGGADGHGKERVADPQALGSYLRAQHLLLRRTRAEVGRELPACSYFTQLLDLEDHRIEDAKGMAADLARMILRNDSKHRGEAMQLSAEFINLLRRQTGIAKAPAVAAFVKLLLDQGEPVVLGGWHHAVYDIWRDLLAAYKPVFYTGNEVDAAKEKSRQQFIAGDTNLMILSVRSGVGLNGLQDRCRTVVVGELDWSPGPHKQFIGRVHRDGQTQPVFAYFVYCDSGSDPIVMDALGLKDQQQRGMIDPWAGDADAIIDDNAAEQRARQLAKAYLEQCAL